jgi:hypothetical protein
MENWAARAGRGAVFSFRDLMTHDTPGTKTGKASFSRAIQKYDRRNEWKRKPLQDEDGISAMRQVNAQA